MRYGGRPAYSPKYFLLSFSLAFLAFALLFMGMTRFIHPSAPVAALTDPEQEPYAPGEEDALTVLFMGCATKDAVSSAYILARFDPAGNRVPVCALSPATAVRNNGVLEPLSEIYRYGGAVYTKEALSETLGIRIDRYLRMDTAGFIAAADAIGAVEYELAESLTLSRDGAAVILGAGRQLLDGRKAAALLARDSGDKTLALQADLTAAIVNQRMDIALSTVTDKIFEKIINSSDSDISHPDYAVRLEAARHMAEQKSAPGFTVPVSGRWSDSRQLFTLSDTCLARLAEAFA